MKRVGMIGLGVMGRNLALNFSDHGVAVVGLDANQEARRHFERCGAGDTVADLGSLVASLPRPRIVILLVPAGAAIDNLLDALLPLLDTGDVVADCGNSFFKETNMRCVEAARFGVSFVGVGLSGGELGARHGPSLMAGGDPEAVASVGQLFCPVVARAQGEPCFVNVGAAGSGHFVKMVHNGIEYAAMQLICESAYLLRRCNHLSPREVAGIFDRWNQGSLESYLLEISAEILAVDDDDTGRPLVDMIVDAAAQKGTGGWTVATALELAVPVPTISAAVEGRSLSAQTEARRSVGSALDLSQSAVPIAVEAVHDALEGGLICAHAQGFALIQAANQHYGWAIDSAAVAKSWRNGCIVRSKLIAEIAEIAPRGNLLSAPAVVARIRQSGPGWRLAVAAAIVGGVPVPALSSAIAYCDSLVSTRLWADLLQAQRDRFGAHGFARIDRDELCHGPWANDP
jgi:6-phosphogluconate dehydrogenase